MLLMIGGGGTNWQLHTCELALCPQCRAPRPPGTTQMLLHPRWQTRWLWLLRTGSVTTSDARWVCAPICVTAPTSALLSRFCVSAQCSLRARSLMVLPMRLSIPLAQSCLTAHPFPFTLASVTPACGTPWRVLGFRTQRGRGKNCRWFALTSGALEALRSGLRSLTFVCFLSSPERRLTLHEPLRVRCATCLAAQLGSVQPVRDSSALRARAALAVTKTRLPAQ